MTQRWIGARIVVVAQEDGATLADCLDGVAEQCPAEVDVLVVDLDSRDGTTEVAIHHPRADRVTVVKGGDLGSVVRAAAPDARRLLLLRADRRPGPGWFAAASAALEGAEVVVGADGDLWNVALDLWALPPVRLTDVTSQEVLLGRAQVAAVRSATSEGMTLLAAASSSGSVTGGLPERPMPPASGPRWTGTISVVLCTRDRPDHLRRCLASLGRLADHDERHEILVVDNNAVPTVDPLALPCRARVVHEPRRGLNVARNRGCTEAVGEVVAYVDDDCEVDPRWLGALRGALADDAVGFVTGRVRAASLATPAARYFESYFSFDRGPIRRRFTPWDERLSFPLWTGPIGTGCNMAMRRSLLVEVGGFDELLDMGSTIGGGGDLDIFARLLDHGAIGEYAPDALVWHHHRDDLDELAKQFRGYGESMGACLTKSALDRPGMRLRAVLFFARSLSARARVAREIRLGRHVLPLRLLLVDLRGALAGPFRYLGARWRAGVR